MESMGVADHIQVSQETFELLKEQYIFEERDRLQVKGKGTMLSYLYKKRRYERTQSGHIVRREAVTPVNRVKRVPTDDIPENQ
jgi:hypothetical protein